MDYETFGLHKHPGSGILEFLHALPAEVLKTGNVEFALPSEVLDRHTPVATYDVPQTISWEDRGNASCVWSENMMQHNMLRKIYGIEKMVLSANCARTIMQWRQLQAADHFYYMTADNEKYRNPFISEQVAFEQYNKIIADFEVAVIHKNLEQIKKSTRLRTAALGILY
jgi:alpha-amylase